jgi:hypothetical protein
MATRLPELGLPSIEEPEDFGRIFRTGFATLKFESSVRMLLFDVD